MVVMIYIPPDVAHFVAGVFLSLSYFFYKVPLISCFGRVYEWLGHSFLFYTILLPCSCLRLLALSMGRTVTGAQDIDPA